MVHKIYKEELCDKLIKHMAKGNSFRTFSLIAKVSRKTLYEWVKKYPEFEEAKRDAEDSCLMFYEKLLTAKISGQNIDNFDPRKSDTSCLIFAMKTRFHKIYGDVQKHEVAIKEAVQVNITTTPEVRTLEDIEK